ncbi:MAG TPA: DUF4058 family protein, partial [Planctomycetaceae bacterium]|nr:DUF4058 family protein [Planctomycetaceae bacterium]
TKRQEYWDAGTNLVEIDLLRGGRPTARIEQEKLEALRPWDYLVLVTRHRPYRQEVYAFRMSDPIPCVPIPLSGADPDVPLDLQSAFAQCWEGGPYPDLLRYEGDPPVRCSAEELAWSRTLLKQAGLLG